MDISASSKETPKVRIDRAKSEYLNDVAEYVRGAIEARDAHNVSLAVTKGEMVLTATPTNQQTLFNKPTKPVQPFVFRFAWSKEKSSHVVWRYKPDRAALGFDVSSDASDLTPKDLGEAMLHTIYQGR